MTKLNEKITREIKPKNKTFWNTDGKEKKAKDIEKDLLELSAISLRTIKIGH